MRIKRSIAAALMSGSFAAVAYTLEYRLVIGAVRLSDSFYVAAVSLLTASSAIVAGLLASSQRTAESGRWRVYGVMIGLVLFLSIAEWQVIADGGLRLGGTVWCVAILFGLAVGRWMRRRNSLRLQEDDAR